MFCHLRIPPEWKLDLSDKSPQQPPDRSALFWVVLVIGLVGLVILVCLAMFGLGWMACTLTGAAAPFMASGLT